MLLLETKASLKHYLELELKFDEMNKETGENIKKFITISEGSLISISFIKATCQKKEIIEIDRAKVTNIFTDSTSVTRREINYPNNFSNIMIDIDASKDCEAKMYTISVYNILDINLIDESNNIEEMYPYIRI